ncbi:Rv3654c family TadE-like protein [Microbispora sp. NPDC049125]|uniref:Rv3654c family TadE-like protein n=1 Tax=Microbispora sp. NPDC049125 TaxID=3154929 RepID=UPI003465C46A
MGSDRGSATIWMTAFMAVLWMVTMTVVYVGVARVARHRAQSAADLSALAVAQWAFATPEGACDRAGAIAVANGARIDSCSVVDGVAEISASVRFAVPLLGDHTAIAMARAGPVGAQA